MEVGPAIFRHKCAVGCIREGIYATRASPSGSVPRLWDAELPLSELVNQAMVFGKKIEATTCGKFSPATVVQTDVHRPPSTGFRRLGGWQPSMGLPHPTPQTQIPLRVNWLGWVCQSDHDDLNKANQQPLNEDCLCNFSTRPVRQVFGGVAASLLAHLHPDVSCCRPFRSFQLGSTR